MSGDKLSSDLEVGDISKSLSNIMSRAYYNYIFTEQMETMARKLHRRSIRDSSNPFEFPDNEFRRLFRMHKNMALYLCEELNGALQPLNPRDGLPVYIKVLSSIRLMADGSYQRGTGQDHGLAIAQTTRTVSKYLTQVTGAIIRILMPKWIVFPGIEDARVRVSNGYQQKFGLPDILGAIDCTHVDIFPPPFPFGVQYKNRKGRTSLNVQLVVDVNSRILSINARFPGRVHDQFIFNHSNIKREMRRLYDNGIGQYYLLGDSGYALEPWLMTPDLEAASNSAAEKYTQWHCQARNCVERANGYLKGTFRCLGIDRVFHYDPEKSSEIVYSCATLYNIMHHYRVPLESVESSDQNSARMDPIPDTEQTNILRVARSKRQSIINTYFNN